MSDAMPTAALSVLALPFDVMQVTLGFADAASARAMVTTCRRFREERHRLLYWRLTRHYSARFVTDEGFRDAVLRLMENPRKQLSLKVGNAVNFREISKSVMQTLGRVQLA